MENQTLPHLKSFRLPRIFLMVLLFSLQPLALSLSQGADIQVFAAASLTDALKEIAPAFEKKFGDKLVFNFASSSLLARQIQEGAPADLFFSADEAKMDTLEKAGLIKRESRKTLLSNTLAIVAIGDSKLTLTSAKDLAGEPVKSIALGQPDTVPAGVYAKEYLTKIGIWPAVEKKVIPTENVRAALAAVESGNADTGIVYKTDALISKKVKIILEIFANDGPSIAYPVAITKAAPSAAEADKFYAYLQTPDVLKIFQKYGFIVRP